ncbi:phage terminase large subunit protein [Rhizobium phaseoli]|uniref:phage terminase large subunit n=1 Tax=Rhizobium phaseoli TaxID=396 RepID=UPI0007EBF372|nr:phage terminase large subunit [Rhizobium phaseoli]ANL71923.1 phage terminase large subunit protein [Rhizobium phaseoli]
MNGVDRLARKLVLEESLLDFTRYTFKARFGFHFIQNDHHFTICNELQDLVDGKSVSNVGEPGPTELLILNMPPRYGKTELGIVNFIPWCFARNPLSKFIHLSYSDKLALDNSSQARELMKHPIVREIWDIGFKPDADAKGLWKTDEGGGLLATAAGGAITGFGAGSTVLGSFGKKFAGAIVIDDPLKPDDANSEVERDKVNERLGNTIISRRNSRETPIILIMQRLHESDMTGYALAGKTGLRVRHVTLPALSDDGKALWPHKHSVEELRAMQAANPYMFAGQYQQRPAPIEGEYFKREWFKFYDELPSGLEYYGASDYAVSDGQGDWTVHIVFGYDRAGDIYVVDLWRERVTSDIWVEAFLNLAARWKPVMWGEEKGQIIKSLDPYIKKRMQERNIYVYREPIASTSDKVTRARPIQARLSARGIYVPRNKPWVEPFISECLVFPNGTNDDQVDGLSKFGQMLDNLINTESNVDMDRRSAW